MLRHLTIKNYALIHSLEMEPSAHLNVITGETGAGKSIMLGAIGLLLGNRADTKVLWNTEEKCVIEGAFNVRAYNLQNLFEELDLDYADETLIRREISPGGKSRAFINDTPVTLESLRRVGALLMDVHSQHETLELGNQSFQLQLIDSYAGNSEIRSAYSQAWKDYTAARKHFEKLNTEAHQLREEADYVNFQLEELTSANLEENEQDALEQELKVAEHAEEIKVRFQSITQLLNESEFSVSNALSEVRGHLQTVASWSKHYEQLLQRFETVRLEIEDLGDEIAREESRIEFDPERAEWVKQRLNTLYHLMTKHRVNDTRALLDLQAALSEKARLTGNLDEALAEARRTLEESEKKLHETANALRATRKKSFAPLQKEITRLLKELGIPNATLEFDLSEIAPGPTGADRIDVLFSANKGIAPRPLAQVASGGEFSRLMFSIKYVMAEKTAMPTLVLDEIDNGISGEVAIKLGQLMKTMARNHQLITISHLPQIAAQGHAHYFVYKDNAAKKTVSSIRLLNAEERIEEIAKMIGGNNPSRVALENAQELLSAAAR